jgi:hypothetical protein
LTEQPGPLHEVIGLGFGDAVNVGAWSFDNQLAAIRQHNRIVEATLPGQSFPTPTPSRTRI